MLPQLVELSGPQECGVAQGRREDVVWHGREEGLGNLEAALIVAVKGGREDGLLAGGVELPVDVALGEQHARVVCQRHGDLGDVSDEHAVLLEEEGSDERAADHGQELVAARVQVRHVEAARADEADGRRDVGADQARDRVDAAHDDAAVLGRRALVVDKLEADVVGAPAVVGGKQHLLLVLVRGGEEQLGLQPLDLGLGERCICGSPGSRGRRARCGCF